MKVNVVVDPTWAWRHVHARWAQQNQRRWWSGRLGYPAARDVCTKQFVRHAHAMAARTL